MRLRRIFPVVFASLLLLAGTLFAQGLIEQREGEILVQVEYVTISEDGNCSIGAIREDGTEAVYIIGEETICDFDAESLQEGDYLLIRDNGMMTMSLPPQIPAAEVRYATTAVSNGLIDADFSIPLRNPGLFIRIAETDGENLDSAFSYSYGYFSMVGLNSQSVYPHGGYFARGILDASGIGETEPMISSEEMNGAIDQYVSEVLSAGITTGYGEICTTLEEIQTLDVPETLEERFAYAYGYFSALNIIFSGIELSTLDFIQGTLTALYGASSAFTEEEMNGFIDAYIQELENEYMAWLSELAATNLAAAEAYLEDNASREGVITLPSGVQIEFMHDDESSSVHPEADSTVVCDYTLTLMDGTVMDAGEDVTFSLQNLIPGFRDAVLEMTAGDTVKAVIHPSLGYGEAGTQTIAPNSLLIFDITLDEII